MKLCKINRFVVVGRTSKIMAAVYEYFSVRHRIGMHCECVDFVRRENQNVVPQTNRKWNLLWYSINFKRKWNVHKYSFKRLHIFRTKIDSHSKTFVDSVNPTFECFGVVPKIEIHSMHVRIEIYVCLLMDKLHNLFTCFFSYTNISMRKKSVGWHFTACCQ